MTSQKLWGVMELLVQGTLSQNLQPEESRLGNQMLIDQAIAYFRDVHLAKVKLLGGHG